MDIDKPLKKLESMNDSIKELRDILSSCDIVNTMKDLTSYCDKGVSPYAKRVDINGRNYTIILKRSDKLKTLEIAGKLYMEL